MVSVPNSKANSIGKESKDISLIFHSEAEVFLDRFQNAPIASTAINHNIIQIAAALIGSSAIHNPPYWFCTIEDSGCVIGAAIYAEPDGLVVSNLPIEELRTLADDLLKSVPSPNRIIADPAIADRLVTYVSQRSGIKMIPSTGWYVGQLKGVDNPSVQAPGSLRRASSIDHDLVVSWGKDYEKEKSAFLDVAEFMSAKLAAGDLYVWEDDVPTTILTVSGKNEFGARVSSVYTPPRHRGYGYATSAVAAVCDELLQSGCDYVVLTWRIGDPAGRIYQRLGFRIIGTQQSFINGGRESG